jgi:hypothetical protein
VSDDDRHSEDFEFDLHLRMRGRRRKAVLPWLVAGLALIGSAGFWNVIERYWMSGG